MNKDKILAQLKIDEGFCEKPYWDRTQWTYGYGCKAPSKNARITESEAAIYLSKRVDQSIREYNEIFGKYNHIDETRQHALVNMLFNLGMAGLLNFKNTLNFIKIGSWKNAANNARKSLWFKQVGKRAIRICKELELGDSLYVKK